MKETKKEKVTKVLIKKDTVVWHEIDKFLKDVRNGDSVPNPIRRWKSFQALYANPFIEYTVDGVEYRHPITSKPIVEFPIFTQTSEGNYCIVVPDTRSVSMQIREKHKGKDIHWTNTMGVWTRSLILHTIRLSKKKIKELEVETDTK